MIFSQEKKKTKAYAICSVCVCVDTGFFFCCDEIFILNDFEKCASLGISVICSLVGSLSLSRLLVVAPSPSFFFFLFLGHFVNIQADQDSDEEQSSLHHLYPQNSFDYEDSVENQLARILSPSKTPTIEEDTSASVKEKKKKIILY